MNQASESKLHTGLADCDGLAVVSAPAPARKADSRDARLRKHADYQRVYGSSRKQFSSSMTWFLSERGADAAAMAAGTGPRVGLTAGKVLGKAHERNRIKRRMRELVRRHVGVLPGNVDLILHPRRVVMTMDFAKLETEVLRIFRQAAGQATAIAPAGRNAAS